MGGNTDFLALYQELGLSADCTLPDLKLAYRKRVSELHPDRMSGDRNGAHGLQRLNGLYSSAMEFQRRHGRLPGSLQALPARAHVATSTAVAQVPAPLRNHHHLLLVLAVLVAGGMFWLWIDQSPTEMPFVRAPTTAMLHDNAAPGASMQGQTIELGSPAQRVRALLGEPVSGWEQRWEYGPSWIEFRCGQVSNWYSSALRPLKVASVVPPPASTWSPPKNCRG